jgi:hypothetical protein
MRKSEILVPAIVSLVVSLLVSSLFINWKKEFFSPEESSHKPTICAKTQEKFIRENQEMIVAMVGNYYKKHYADKGIPMEADWIVISSGDLVSMRTKEQAEISQVLSFYISCDGTVQFGLQERAADFVSSYHALEDVKLFSFPQQ